MPTQTDRDCDVSLQDTTAVGWCSEVGEGTANFVAAETVNFPGGFSSYKWSRNEAREIWYYTSSVVLPMQC